MLPGTEFIVLPLSSSTGQPQPVGSDFKDPLEDGKGLNVAFTLSLKRVCQFTGLISFILYLSVGQIVSPACRCYGKGASFVQFNPLSSPK